MALLAVIPACGFESKGNNDGGMPDAASTCFGSFTPVCFTTVADIPTMPAMLPSDLTIEIDTDSSTMCDQNNDQMGNYCVIAGAGFTLAANQSIRGYGSKPLVLLSTTTIDLQGTVDVSSSHISDPDGKNIGASANPSACGNGTTAQGTSGASGGSFGGRGGAGEMIDPDAAGIAAMPLMDLPTALRGGCAGGIGGGGGGAGGDGGGAIALVAGTKIDLNGKVNASGAGGQGGSATKCGGGGGGSGGMIVLDAPQITGTGSVFANGGGGAEGGAGSVSGGTAAAGSPGGESTGPTMSASKGGTTATEGGDGGDGSSGTAPGGATAAGQSSKDGGGGAGGGGAGFVHAPGVTNIAPPSKNPAQT
jgi:hypothetical protein